MKKLKIFLVLFLFLQLTALGGEKVYASTKIISYISNVTNIPAIAVEMPGTSEDIINKLSDVQVRAFDSNGGALLLPVTWNFSTVNLSVAGAYRLQGIVKVPEGYELADGLRLPVIQTSVSVQRKGNPDINVYYEADTADFLIFPWVTYHYADRMKVWLRKSEGDWENITETGMVLCTNDGLRLSKQALVMGNTYSLIVGYGDKMTKTLKFVYGTDKKINIITYQSEFIGSAVDPSKCIFSYNEDAWLYADRYYAEAFPVGADITAMLEKLSERTVLSVSTFETFEDTDENPALKLRVQWDLSDVNMEMPGVYRITGRFVIPEGYSVRKDLKLPVVHVYITVQEMGNPQIDTCYFSDEYTLCFPSLFRGLTQEQYKSLKVYLKKFGGEFTDISRDGAYIKAEGIYLDAVRYIQNCSSYEIYAEYKDGCTDIYSFTYKEPSIFNEMRTAWVTEEDDDSEDEDENPEDDENLGEDDADSEDDEMNDAGEDETGDSEDEDDNGGYGGNYYSGYSGSGYSSNASSGSDDTSAVSTASSIATVKEETDDISTVLSGKNLNLMIEEPGDKVTFEKGGISVQIPETVVKGWGIGEDESFKITVQMISDKGFSVRVFAKDEEIKDIPGTSVKLSTADFIGITAPESVQVKDIDGNTSASTYNNAKGSLEITLNKTGDYFMDDGQEKSNNDDFLDDTYMADEGMEDDVDVPVDEEFWEDEEIFADSEFSEDEEGLIDEEFTEESFGDEEYVEGDEFFGDEDFVEDFDGEDISEEDSEETEGIWYENILSRIFEVIDNMKEKGTLIPAAVSIGAALILIVLFAGGKRKK